MKKPDRETLKNILSIILLVVFVGMIALGYLSGEAQIVLTKARNICMECIGIG